jgi:hypothetical protein
MLVFPTRALPLWQFTDNTKGIKPNRVLSRAIRKTILTAENPPGPLVEPTPRPSWLDSSFVVQIKHTIAFVYEAGAR